MEKNNANVCRLQELNDLFGYLVIPVYTAMAQPFCNHKGEIRMACFDDWLYIG